MGERERTTPPMARVVVTFEAVMPEGTVGAWVMSLIGAAPVYGRIDLSVEEEVPADG